MWETWGSVPEASRVYVRRAEVRVINDPWSGFRVGDWRGYWVIAEGQILVIASKHTYGCCGCWHVTSRQETQEEQHERADGTSPAHFRIAKNWYVSQLFASIHGFRRIQGILILAPKLLTQSVKRRRKVSLKSALSAQFHFSFSDNLAKRLREHLHSSCCCEFAETLPGWSGMQFSAPVWRRLRGGRKWCTSADGNSRLVQMAKTQQIGNRQPS